MPSRRFPRGAVWSRHDRYADRHHHRRSRRRLFVPTVVAGFRAHHNASAICMLNLALGWTLLGWVAALVWACTSPSPARRSDQPYAADADDRAIRRAIRRGARR
jgi:hypothetical protein